jgi:hypothetical protein
MRHFSGSTVADPPFNDKFLCAAASADSRQRKCSSIWEKFKIHYGTMTDA